MLNRILTTGYEQKPINGHMRSIISFLANNMLKHQYFGMKRTYKKQALIICDK